MTASPKCPNCNQTGISAHFRFLCGNRSCHTYGLILHEKPTERTVKVNNRPSKALTPSERAAVLRIVTSQIGASFSPARAAELRAMLPSAPPAPRAPVNAHLYTTDIMAQKRKGA